MAIGYSTFANGGFKVSSYYIDRVEDADGKIVQQANPAIACARMRADPAEGLSPRSPVSAAHATLLDEAPRDGKTLIPVKNLAPQIIRPQVAYLLADMMADVIKRGTGQRARTLNRDDIAGKTGTTSDSHDAWFNGFNGDIVATVWTGFDQDRTLGEGEQGCTGLGSHLDLFHAAGARGRSQTWGAGPGRHRQRAHIAEDRLARQLRRPQRHHGEIHRGKAAQAGTLRGSESEQPEADKRW